jgi:hypothetical protein
VSGADPEQVRLVVGTIACAGLVVSSAEWLVDGSVGDGGGLLAPWPAGRPGRLVRVWWSGGLRALIAVRAVAAAAFVAVAVLGGPSPVGTFGTVGTVALGLVAATCLLLCAPDPIGVRLAMDGAEHMLTAVVVVLAASAVAGTRAAAGLALVFVAGLALLEYAGSGCAKLGRRAGWLDGSCLRRVLASPDYGHPRLARWSARHGAVTRAVSLAVVALEVGGPLALLVPRPLAVAMVVGLLAFHVGTAVAMGLNTFVWAYGAALPAILYGNSLLRG